VRLDSQAEEQALCREVHRQRGRRVRTTARQGTDKSPARPQRVKLLKPRQNNRGYKPRRDTVAPRQGFLTAISELDRGWLRGTENNRWVWAAMGVAVQRQHYRAWQAGRSTWASKPEVRGRAEGASRAWKAPGMLGVFGQNRAAPCF
jgi:hypothetical protein